MAGFSIRNPFFIIVCCLIIAIVGTVTLVRMPVDLFPPINIPVVVVATFYSGMPPQQIEASITNPFERFFTLASGVDHIESRSLPGVSLVRVYFQAGSNADSDVSTIANLAMAQLRRLPQGTLPPVVLKFDASSLPVCLVTLKGQGLNETVLHDLGQYNVRNQIANVPGASVPQPFGGKYRQIMVYVDPLKLEAHQLSPMDVVRQVNESNLILPAGDVKIGPFDYNLYSNAQAPDANSISAMPLKTVGQSSVMVADVGKAVDAQAIQTNIVRVDGQPSVYLPILKQGGDTNTIAVVDGIRDGLKHLVDVPKQLLAKVVFDQSVFVKTAIHNLINEGTIGLVLTGLMILLFLGSMRATAAVFLSIPLSALAAFLVISAGGGTVNTMVLGGLALVFSRLIDNSVIVLENIFRHLEMGESPEVAAEKGGNEVALAVLAATLTTAIVFFPVVFLYGVSRFLFMALASSVVFALFASYVVAMTVVPMYCAKLVHKHEADEEEHGDDITVLGRVVERFNERFAAMLVKYDTSLAKSLLRPVATVAGLAGISLLALTLYPLLGVSFFPRTDPGQFVINVKAPSGTRVELTEEYVKQVENIIREVVPPKELQMVVSNIGITPDFSVIYTSNSAPHTAFVQASLREGHSVGSYEYMRRVRERIQKQLPQLSTYFQSGGLVDAVLNLGLPAPMDIQVSGSSLRATHAVAAEIASKTKQLPGVSDVLIPQDIDHPAHFQRNDCAQLLGRSEKRQSLPAHRAISGKCGKDYVGPATDSPARTEIAAAHFSRFGGDAEEHLRAHRSRSLSTCPRDGYLRRAKKRRPRQDHQPSGGNYPKDELAGRRARHAPWLGAGHARLLPEFRHGTHFVRGSGLSDSGGAIRLVVGPADYFVGRAARSRRRAVVSAGHRDDTKRDVANGCGDDGGHRGLQQHLDRGVRAPSPQRGEISAGSGGNGIEAAPAAGADDFLREPARLDSPGIGHRSRQRSLRAIGQSDHRRLVGLRCSHGVSGAGGVSAGAREKRNSGGASMNRNTTAILIAVLLTGAGANGTAAQAQTPEKTATAPPAASNTVGRRLTLQEAEAIALRNNPQIAVGKLKALVARQFVRETRAALLPAANL